MKKWEYRVANVGESTDWAVLQDNILTKLGKDGWELVAVTKDLHAKDRALYIFKKPLAE